MSIKRYIANKDTTITNAFRNNLIERAEDANIGAADSLEIFSVYNRLSNATLEPEKSRILIQFPIENIISDRAISKVPQSGSMKFFLRMFNVKHPYTLPKNYKVHISNVTKSWDEGYGLDMENYTDLGWKSTVDNGNGATWQYAQSGSLWQTPGSYTNSEYNLEYNFDTGIEDIDLDVTDLVEEWISGTLPNNGFLIKLSGSFEDGTLKRSFYTKKFSARSSEFFFRRPALEARWEAINTDDRGNFYAKSDALSDSDNTMCIYFYNKVNGRLKNIVGNPTVEISLFTNEARTNEITPDFVQVTNPSAGVYKAEIIVDTTASVLYDQWFSTAGNYFYSSIDVLQRTNSDTNSLDEYVVNIINNKGSYTNSEVMRFNIFARQTDWQPTIYTKAYNTIENTCLQDLYYKIFRLSDNYVVVDYSTGSLAYTKTSYDSTGNYFDLDMSLLEEQYTYGIKLARYDGINLIEFPDTFKFKVG